MCRSCQTELLKNVNWPPSRYNKRNRICSPCHTAQCRAWEARNPERHLETHARRSRKSRATDAYRAYARGKAEKRRRAAGMTAYTKDPSGWVYVLTNAAWPGHSKIGHAHNLSKRLSSYQTSSPHRDFQIIDAAQFANRRDAERKLHADLKGHRIGTTEWFYLHPADARNHLIRLTKQENCQ